MILRILVLSYLLHAGADAAPCAKGFEAAAQPTAPKMPESPTWEDVVAHSFTSTPDTAAGVVFVCDVTGQQILRVRDFIWKYRLPFLFGGEREVLVKDGRNPRTIRAAIVYEGGQPVALYTNPNFVAPEGNH